MPVESLSSRTAQTRKSHKKSRGGCVTCKARRVKCDEFRPICKACTRRQEACVWQQTSPDPLGMILPNAATSFLRISKENQLSLPPLNDFRVKDLELLHNFTTNTLLTFIPDLPPTRHGYQVLLPQLAFQNQFLLHAMFAISSLHMHSLRPSSDSNYLALSKMHCQHAILGLYNASTTGKESTVSSDAMFMAQTLLGTYWLASPSWASTSNDDDMPDVFDWVPPTRTFMRKIGEFEEDLLKGIIDAPSYLPPELFRDKPSTLAPFPNIFYNIHRPAVCPFDTEELDDPNIIGVYELALRKISNTWSAFMHPKIQNLSIYVFLSGAPARFFELFSERRPRAMIILAHYCAILGQFDGAWWYTQDRFRRDLRRILSLLDDKWLPWMEYPLNVLAMYENSLNIVFPSFGTVDGDSDSGGGSSGSSPFDHRESVPVESPVPIIEGALWALPNANTTDGIEEPAPAVQFEWPNFTPAFQELS
ncbi:hypothetical protein DL96DRAFT_1572841 [Flagelloscypha sp. PMI_526]|nr:hypothetical protein DL96DRAFT_1572841 [Flagelloscypha sp. PMI_526]